MKKILISLFDCQPGMQIAENIFNEYGAVIVSENTILDSHILHKLENLGIERVRIADSGDNLISANSTDVFKAQYNENVEVVKDLLHDISTGRKINLEKANVVTDSIFDRVNEKRDIITCLNQINGVDDYTYTHSINVSLVSMLIGKWMKLDSARERQLVLAGLLHDIGKSMISREILDKPGALSSTEFEEVKKHPVYGYRLLEKEAHMENEVRIAVLMHHEREDGSGYPMKLKGPQICDFAKIIAVADIYDAMTSNRVYSGKTTPFDVFDFFENKTFGILDPRVVNAFLKNIAAYYIGDFVRLTNDNIGEIVYINPMHISQPLIKTASGYIDLSLEKNIKIIELI